MQEAEIIVRCLHPSCSTLFFETDSIIEPEVYRFSSLVTEHQESAVSGPQALELQACTAAFNVLHGCWEAELKFMLVQKTFYPVTHLLSP